MKLMDVIRRRLVEAEYLPATRTNYEQWVRRYVRHHLPRHPREVGLAGVEAYITHLATERNLSASSQNQALSAIAFLYSVLGVEIETAHLRAKAGHNQPATAAPAAIMAVIEALRAQMDTARNWPGNVAGYVFPSSRIVQGRCWYVSPSSLQKAMVAVQRGSARRITPLVLRNSFVAGLLDRYDPVTVKEVCGYADVTPLVRWQEQSRRAREPVSPKFVL